jgi:hypothetical protein
MNDSFLVFKKIGGGGKGKTDLILITKGFFISFQVLDKSSDRLIHVNKLNDLII